MWRAWGAVVMGLGVSVAAWGASVPPTEPFAYAVFGLTDVTLAGGVSVEHGDVGVNLGTLALGPRAHVAGNLAADTITLKRHSRAGGFFCHVLDTTGAETCTAVTVPLVAASSLTLVQVLPGAISVDVGRDGPAAPLPPGDYGSVRIQGRARLVLAGGDAPYNLRDLHIGPRGRLVCSAPCRIQVRDDVGLAGSAHLGGGAGVRIDVGGGGPAPAFRAGPRAAVTAVVYAPSGTILLGGAGRYTGAFVGRAVRIGPRARVAAVAP